MAHSIHRPNRISAVQSNCEINGPQHACPGGPHTRSHCKNQWFISHHLSSGRRYSSNQSDSIHCSPRVSAYGSKTVLHRALLFGQSHNAIFRTVIRSGGLHPTVVTLRSYTAFSHIIFDPWPTIHRPPTCPPPSISAKIRRPSLNPRHTIDSILLHVITQTFLEVVGRGKGSEVTTKQASGIESSQSVPREGSLYKI